ncbi:DUF2945 domain-containing protein [Ramlibacter sp. AW1]|uniref:DUF2945 domain-containing protein n=1 Tax=Ramlibacter aurantiacus TaxID=2801330 RepID=A0A937D611_9BURK|nr:DUF2945 domain-containing protein [Ramlibacter aurantiacus]MBL0423260.1 DUF2945 domain-containing protein [Ramlibacter aurantiacus]
MSDKFRASDASEWNSHGSIGRGKVRKKLTARTLLKGHAVASDDESTMKLEALPTSAEVRAADSAAPSDNEPER